LKGLEEGLNVETIYLDFSKAFDKVDIGILCKRLKEKGVTGNLGIWIHDFLTNRKQYVIANNVISKESAVKSGVPQGTVLGPFLFLLMMDSLSDLTIESVVRMFADDTRVTKHVKTDEDMESLQEDIEILYKW
jgi:hypothetical protein